MANLGSNHEEVMMVQAERYDMLVLSSGEGGKFLAWHMAKSGQAQTEAQTARSP
jgi:hypothetical protein